MLDRVGRAMGRRRRSRLAPRVDAALVRLHQLYENLNYDMWSNGELRVLERFAEVGDVSTIFDVGAHVGGWTKMAARQLPSGAIHSFEIVPETYRELARNLSGVSNAHLHDVGLSNHSGDASVNYVPGGSGISTMVDGAIESFFGIQTQRLTARLAVGDEFCAEHGISQIDLLKVDVEGAEYDVLMGFQEMLNSGAISAVQFEYGYVNIITKRLLRDFHLLLEGADMVVGKIYPNYVEFREYRVQHEDFLGPNFLAVHRSQERLIRALS